MNLPKIQGLGTVVSFGELGKTCGVPRAIMDKVQDYPIPKEVAVILGYW